MSFETQMPPWLFVRILWARQQGAQTWIKITVLEDSVRGCDETNYFAE